MAANERQVEVHVLTIHGGRVDLAVARYPQAPKPWIDLSTGINPHAWDATAVDLHWQALPDVTALAGLEAAARAAFGLAAGGIAGLPGTEIGLRLLRDIGLAEPSQYVAPSYATHAEALPDMNAIAVADIAATRGTVLIANPNNPDGRIIPPAELLSIARARDAGSWMIVDEAFADVDPAISVLPHLRDDDRVLVFRSFGKIFGLAGLRLGFVCGPAAIVDRFRARLGSWPVSSAAIAIGTAAYRDTAWITATRARLSVHADRLDALLRTHALEPHGECPLFRLVRDDRARALADRLAEAGILTRAFAHHPGWLRFGLPSDEQAWSRLSDTLRRG
jgi:cobalamin biosynthetic protein CobC